MQRIYDDECELFHSKVVDVIESTPHTKTIAGKVRGFICSRKIAKVTFWLISLYSRNFHEMVLYDNKCIVCYLYQPT